MRHGTKNSKKFHRKTGQRRAFMRGLVVSLLRVGRMETTEVRAKAVRPQAEKMISIAKKQNLAARRLLLARLQNKKLVAKLIEEIAPKYTERKGGYLRIVKSGKTRKRDGTRLAVIELV
ncbi:MAG TPA: 50S ribosomal protein L17 [Candidatus Paceibacterota bacterium]